MPQRSVSSQPGRPRRKRLECWVRSSRKRSRPPTSTPLTVNALVAACNQRSNRDPVVDYDDRNRGAGTAGGWTTSDLARPDTRQWGPHTCATCIGCQSDPRDSTTNRLHSSPSCCSADRRHRANSALGPTDTSPSTMSPPSKSDSSTSWSGPFRSSADSSEPPGQKEQPVPVSPRRRRRPQRFLRCRSRRSTGRVGTRESLVSKRRSVISRPSLGRSRTVQPETRLFTFHQRTRNRLDVIVSSANVTIPMSHPESATQGRTTPMSVIRAEYIWIDGSPSRPRSCAPRPSHPRQRSANPPSGASTVHRRTRLRARQSDCVLKPGEGGTRPDPGR
jgi:hypothetical protein